MKNIVAVNILLFAVFFDTGSTNCHDLTFNIGQHAIGVTAATTRSFTIKVSKARAGARAVFSKKDGRHDLLK